MDNNTPKKFGYDQGASGAVVLFFIFLFVFAKWGPAIPFSVLSQSKGEPMVVMGEGKATIIPDVAKISVGIESSGQTLKSVQSDANQKSQKLVSALKNLDIKEDDIKTTGYNIYPESDYTNPAPSRIVGYRVSLNYEITVRDIDSVNDVLAAVTPAGANTVGGINFDLSDSARSKAMDAARSDAVSKAKENAKSLANASGVTLGKIINVTESQGVNPRPFYMAEKAVTQDAMGIPEPDIQPGTTEINITVSLSYEVR